MPLPNPPIPPPAPDAAPSNSVTAPTTRSSAPSISPIGAAVSLRIRPDAPRSCSLSTSPRVCLSRTMNLFVLKRAVTSWSAMPSPISLVHHFQLLCVLSLKRATAILALGPLYATDWASSIEGPPCPDVTVVFVPGVTQPTVIVRYRKTAQQTAKHFPRFIVATSISSRK